MSQYRMIDDSFLVRFKNFMASERRMPEGAFDAMPKAVTRKESTMSKFRYVPIDGTNNAIFHREPSSNMAFDEAEVAKELSASAKQILEFLRDKLSGDDLRQVEESLRNRSRRADHSREKE